MGLILGCYIVDFKLFLADLKGNFGDAYHENGKVWDIATSYGGSTP